MLVDPRSRRYAAGQSESKCAVARGIRASGRTMGRRGCQQAKLPQISDAG
jgi:hypothetical protein